MGRNEGEGEAGRGVRSVLVREVLGGRIRPKPDEVAVEAPLEVRLMHGRPDARTERTICVTMRTPGADRELVLGYLFAEGVIGGMADVAGIRGGAEEGDQACVVDLSGHLPVDVRRLERTVFTASSCGACGAPSLDAVAHVGCPGLPAPAPMVDADLVSRLPEMLRNVQVTFHRTGGLHAAALFDAGGRLLDVREDVGRHNALDKLIGACLSEGLFPLREHVVLVSGRASYELVQKVLRAGIPVLAAVGAPSSLAIELAQGHDLTLLGFVRNGRYNAYHGEGRLRRVRRS